MITLLRLAVWENAEQVNTGCLTCADLVGELLVLQGFATCTGLGAKGGIVPMDISLTL